MNPINTETARKRNVKLKSYNIQRKFRKISLNKFIKTQNLTKKINLKKIAKLQAIKSHDDLLKEDLIYTLLRSEKHPLENNYMKYIN